MKMTNKKFSLSAIFLIILLAIRFMAQIYLFFIFFPFISLVDILFAGILILLTTFYLIAVIGVIKKTDWGLNFALAIAILDIILGGFLGFVYGISFDTIGALIVNLIIIGLITKIQKRIKK